MWYALTSAEVNDVLFKVQTLTILDINNELVGYTVSGLSPSLFGKIFFNNLNVLIFCILFSFLYGVGSIFILTWNGSVIAAAIGNFISSSLPASSGYVHATALGVLRYSLHGIPEITAYIVAGLAGGIISVAVIRHDFSSKKNIKKARIMGVKHVGIAPTGKSEWDCSAAMQEKIKRERAQVEGCIGTVKTSRYGFNKPNARSVKAMETCGHRAILGFNLRKLVREQAKLQFSPA